MNMNLSVKKKTHKKIKSSGFHWTLEYVLLSRVLEAVGAAELSKAQHRLEKQRCEELECRVHKMQEELQKLQTDKERLGQVGTVCSAEC